MRDWTVAAKLLIVAIAVAIPAYMLLAGAAEPDGGDSIPHQTAEARLQAVRAAAMTLVDGAVRLAAKQTDVHGDQRCSGPLVTYAMALRRRLDLSAVPMDDARGGPVEPMLRLAQAQEAVLRRAAFCPMAAEWRTLGNEGRAASSGDEMLDAATAEMIEPPRDPRPEGTRPRRGYVYVGTSEQSDSGSGGGRTQISLRDPQIVHHRIYVVPHSGATLFVRNTYDQATKIVEVELSYSDRTHFDVEYAHGSHIADRQPGHYAVHEAIVEAK